MHNKYLSTKEIFLKIRKLVDRSPNKNFFLNIWKCYKNTLSLRRLTFVVWRHVLSCLLQASQDVCFMKDVYNV